MTEADRLGLALSGILNHFEIETAYVDEIRTATDEELSAFVLTCVEIIRSIAEADAVVDACDCDQCTAVASWPMESNAIH
jgi:hypothetical protein